jgi:hypothetical protein
MDDQGSFPCRGRVFFLFATASRPALWSTQPPIERVPDTLSLEVKRPGHEAGHSLPSSAEVKTASYLYVNSYKFINLAFSQCNSSMNLR